MSRVQIFAHGLEVTGGLLFRSFIISFVETVPSLVYRDGQIGNSLSLRRNQSSLGVDLPFEIVVHFAVFLGVGVGQQLFCFRGQTHVLEYTGFRQQFQLFLELFVFSRQPLAFLHLLLVAQSQRGHFFLGVFLLEPGRCNFLLGFLQLCSQGEALALEEVELSRQGNAVLISFHLDIDVAIGLLRDDQIVAHLFKHVHKGPQKMFFLANLVILVEFIKRSDLVENVLVYAVKIVLVDHLRLNYLSSPHPQQKLIQEYIALQANRSFTQFCFERSCQKYVDFIGLMKQMLSEFAVQLLDLMQNNHPGTGTALQNRENLSQTANRIPLETEKRVEISSHMRINADDETSCRILAYVIMLILFIIVVSLISFLALPQATKVLWQRTELSGTNIAECDKNLVLNDSDVVCNINNTAVAGQYVQNLVELNQFLFFYLNIHNTDASMRRVEINEDIVFRLYHTGRKEVNGFVHIYTKELITQATINIDGETKDHFEGNRFFLSFVNKLSSSDEFYWEVRLKPDSVFLTSINFNLSSVVVNTEFTLFTIILRVVFFVISVIVFLLFNRVIIKVPKTKVTVQQRFVQLLSAITLTFNDQFYFISVIYPNPVTSFISSFFIWNYVFVLFLMWGLFLSRILYEQHETTSTELITKCKVVLIVLFYILGLTYNGAYAISQTQNHPILTTADLRSRAVIALKAFSYLSFGLASLYILYLNIQIVRKRSNRMYRSSVFMYVSLLFFLSTIIFFFIGGYNIFDYSAPKIMFYITFMNFYSYFMQYLYCPTNEQVNRFENWEDRPLRGSQLIEIDNQTIDINIDLENRSDKSYKSDKSDSSFQKKQGSIKRKRRIDRKRKEMNNSNELKESSEKLSEHHHQLRSESVQDH